MRRDVPASSLVVKPGGQDREEFNADDLASLAASIAAQGILQIPGVRETDGDLAGPRFEIVFGERRVRAMRDVLGWETIPVDVLDLTDEQASWGMLIENTLRQDLDPIAEAKAYRDRIDRFDITPARIAAETGLSPARIRDRLKLLQLSDHVAHWVAKRQLPLRHALLMVHLDVNRQALALRAYQEHSPAVDAFGALCSRLLDEQAAEEAEGMFDADGFLRLAEYVREAEEVVRVDAPEPIIVRERVMGLEEISAEYGMATSVLRRWCRDEKFPAPDLRVGGQHAWYEATVETWATDSGHPVVQRLAL